MKRFSVVFVLALGLSLLLAACGGGDDTDSGSGGDSGAGGTGSGAVAIEGFAFKPADVTVPTGTKVTWTNKDSAAHTVDPSGDLFPTSPNIEGDTTFSHTYDKAGTFPYVCGIHNYMTGSVVVT